ncbi:Uncharacterised protein [Mycobacteroides abscessus subsp. abscessus]|nr:Uncharacterised protein [Mycobacteroides abscessus subsp. abscessus]
MANRIGAVNKNANSIGSVTPKRKEVNAAGTRIAFATALFFLSAAMYMARAAPIRPNILLKPRASQLTVSLSTFTDESAISAK